MRAGKGKRAIDRPGRQRARRPADRGSAVPVLALVCQDGETHGMEGAMMLGVYVIIALAFYNLPS